MNATMGSVISRPSLTAYNVTLWLEGDKGIDVKTERIKIPVLPPAIYQPEYVSRTVTFLISVLPDAVGNHTLKPLRNL